MEWVVCWKEDFRFCYLQESICLHPEGGSKNTASSSQLKSVDGRLEVRKVPPCGESQSVCGTDRPGT